VVALAFVLGLGLLGAFRDRLVERMIFLPTRGADPVPEGLGVPVEEVFLETSDGVRIHAYWLERAGATRAVLFLHGNAGNASHRLPNAALIAQQGASVLLLDYRGYGRSEGSPSEEGLYRDARAGLAHLVSQRSIPEQRIVVFGRSLGGAVAVELARDRPLAGVILESTFPSIAAIARELGGPLLAAAVGPHLESESRIDRLRAPLLFFHGDRDEVVPQALGRRLFARAPDPKHFESLAGAGHNDTVWVGGAAYLHTIRDFLDRVAPESPRPEP